MSHDRSSTRTDDLSVVHRTGSRAASAGAEPAAAPVPGPGPVVSAAPAGESVGQLVSDLTQQVSHLVRDEVQLAKMDLTEKGKKAGKGLGAFSVAGLLAFFGIAALVTTAIAALALVLDVWLSALIVAVVLLAVAAVAALVGKKEVQQATPPVPQAAVDGVKKDIDAVKEGFKR
ncbi:phage holin family protein [Paenibacillus sp. TRM 82003]|uniref:phage holin family protein n=1 Tax=Kineococcus sp. TRM81007 TaxID=2925831 RepID=UPI001F5A9855|nr:phage holin family protein [Kineococcus sp. TRM81007]MCI2237820.1 phage holin family protein [Kineococcus sp. TRM81007]MCI3926653.1 phage holin family protein [Paenibacillus sp. TRM 82003]